MFTFGRELTLTMLFHFNKRWIAIFCVLRYYFPGTSGSQTVIMSLSLTHIQQLCRSEKTAIFVVLSEIFPNACLSLSQTSLSGAQKKRKPQAQKNKSSLTQIRWFKKRLFFSKEPQSNILGLYYEAGSTYPGCLPVTRLHFKQTIAIWLSQGTPEPVSQMPILFNPVKSAGLVCF